MHIRTITAVNRQKGSFFQLGLIIRNEPMIISWLYLIWDLNFLLCWFKLLTNIFNGRGACTCILLTTVWDLQNLTFLRQSVIIMINFKSTLTPITKETWRLLPILCNKAAEYDVLAYVLNILGANRFWKLSKR